MEKQQTFNNSNNIIKFGYEFIQPKRDTITLEDILTTTSEALIVYDTKNFVFNQLVSIGSSFLNDTNKKFIALISAKMLKEAKSMGIKNGFLRSTQEESNIAIIISDKTKAFLLLDEKNIFKTKENVGNELFNYINHLIWSKTDFEVIQGSDPSPVKTLRLSVVKPNFINILAIDKMKEKTFKQGTEEFIANETLLTVPKENNKKTHLVNAKLTSIGIDSQMYLNAFDKYYIPCILSKAIYVGESFNNSPLSLLQGKRVWIEGSERQIIKERIEEKTVFVPLDEYETFKPDYESYINKQTDKFVCEIKVKINIQPTKIDNSYTLSKRYSSIDKINNTLKNQIEALKKLINDDKTGKKQLERIEKERNLVEKVKLYNHFINELKLGDDTLINKKDNKFLSITIVEKDILVPSELIGKLYEKKDSYFLAVKTQDKIEDAKKWLLDNSQKATLVLENEENN